MATKDAARLLEMAKAARPIDDSDYGSERQVAAFNAFTEEAEATGALGDSFDGWCLKATCDEIIDEALKRMGVA